MKIFQILSALCVLVGTSKVAFANYVQLDPNKNCNKRQLYSEFEEKFKSDLNEQLEKSLSSQLNVKVFVKNLNNQGFELIFPDGKVMNVNIVERTFSCEFPYNRIILNFDASSEINKLGVLNDQIKCTLTARINKTWTFINPATGFELNAQFNYDKEIGITNTVLNTSKRID